MEQILPSTKHVSDPRDFYASDSPILDDNFDSDLDLYESAEEFLERVDPEVQDDRQVGSGFAGSRVCSSRLAYTIRVNWCEAFPAASDPSASAFVRTAVQPSPTNCTAFIISADVASATTNDFRSVTLMSCYSEPAPGRCAMRSFCASDGLLQWVPFCWVPERQSWPTGNSYYRHQLVRPDCDEL